MKGRIKYRKTGALRIVAEGTEVYGLCKAPDDRRRFFEKVEQSPAFTGGLLLLENI